VTVAVRVLLVVVAVLAGAWLVHGLPPIRDQQAGLAAVSAHDGRSPQQRVARARRLLERSAAHTRSTDPDVHLAQLDAFTGHPDRAVRRLEVVVAHEPANLDAWQLLAQTARTVDPAVAARAQARARRLSPPVPADR
jgi:predicted Zn-dependent protease